MGRFFRLTLGVLIVSAAAIVASRLSGNSHTPLVAALFTNPDGTPCQRPCLFGIRPGQTTLDEAVALLRVHPLTQSLKRVSFGFADTVHFGSENAGVQIGRRRGESKLAWVHIDSYTWWFPRPLLADATLADIASVLGPPSRISFDQSREVGLVFLSDGLAMSSMRSGPTDATPVSFSDPVYTLELYDPTSVTEGITSSLAEYRPWSGFTSFRQYKLVSATARLRR